MCRSRTERVRLARVFAIAACGVFLGGCSDFFAVRYDDYNSYVDRRDTVALPGGDAVAGNTVTQMVDPWPAYSGDKNIAFNGQKMQGAVQRYRTGKVIEPADPENFMSTNQQGQSISTTVNNGSPAPAASTTPSSQ